MSEVEQFVEQLASLTTDRIEGIAVMGNVPFSVPIITQIEGNLWQGGTPADVAGAMLPAYFRYALNLYPWGTYRWHNGTEIRVARLYDRGEIPDTTLLEDLAAWVNEKRAIGPTLVHCQAGLNRSALVTALALIRSGMAADDAILLLRSKRSPAVLCNAAFEQWLREQA